MSYIVAVAARWTKSLKFTLSIAVHRGGLAKNHFWLVATQKKRIGEQLNYFWNMCPELLAGAALKTCKRLFGCKFFHNGHVEDLQCCPLVNKAYSLFQYEAKPTSPQCGHDDYLAFWDRCDRIMLYRISGAALYIFIKFFLFDIGPFRRRWFFSTFISTFILFSVFSWIWNVAGVA